MGVGSLGPRDTSGREIVSQAIVPGGWTFHVPTFRFTSSTASSIDFDDKFGNDMSSMIDLAFYDTEANYNSYTQCAPASANFTVATFNPSYAYYIVSGGMRQTAAPASPVYLYATLAPRISYGDGGSREFICCADLTYRLDGHLEQDGRSPKYVPFAQVNPSPPPNIYSNSIEIFLRHNTGFAHTIEIEIGLFKE